MTETLIANVDQNMVTVRAVSEANSVRFKINLRGTPDLSSKISFVKVNDVTIVSPTNLSKDALNVRIMTNVNDPSVHDPRFFKMKEVDDSQTNGFIQLMDTSTAPLIALITYGSVKSNDVLDAWFTSVGSVNWPGANKFNNYNFAYVAFYSPISKRIVMEGYVGENKVSNAAYVDLETICDVLTDVGSTGFPKNAVYDPTEYVSTSEYEFKRYPDNLLVAKLSDYGIKPGALMYLSAELYQSKELVDAGLTTRLNLRWYKQNTLLDFFSINVPPNVTDEWFKIRDVFSRVPATADGFIIVTARYPRNDSVVALGSIRNVSFTEVSHGDEKGRLTSMSVNGIRSTNFVEDEMLNLILNLPDAKIAEENKINIVGIRELENEY